MSDTIIAALKALDTTNDAHWTTDGLPRLETVKYLAKDQSLTRDDVTNAAPGFTRTNTELQDLVAEGGDEQSSPVEEPAETVTGAEGQGAPGEEDFPADEAAEAQPGEVESAFIGDDADAVAGLQADLEEAEAVLADLMAQKDALLKEIDKVGTEADRIRDAITTARGTSDNTDVILQALESRKRQAEERGQVQQAIAAAGVDVQALVKATSKAPIDQAMARKTGFGGKRPAHQ